MVKISEELKAQFLSFFREMDSGGIAGFAPEHVVSLDKKNKVVDLSDREAVTTK